VQRAAAGAAPSGERDLGVELAGIVSPEFRSFCFPRRGLAAAAWVRPWPRLGTGAVRRSLQEGERLG
jgi:hypothetical protein